MRAPLPASCLRSLRVRCACTLCAGVWNVRVRCYAYALLACALFVPVRAPMRTHCACAYSLHACVLLLYVCHACALLCVLLVRVHCACALLACVQLCVSMCVRCACNVDPDHTGTLVCQRNIFPLIASDPSTGRMPPLSFDYLCSWIQLNPLTYLSDGLRSNPSLRS